MINNNKFAKTDGYTTPHDFCSGYEVIRVTNATKQEIIDYLDLNYLLPRIKSHCITFIFIVITCVL